MMDSRHIFDVRFRERCGAAPDGTSKVRNGPFVSPTTPDVERMLRRT
ncbi:hypothetical protein [uncultured Tateyamaria sp.]|nr:hypothetical protein [uncultured Tateyamaria sp.]